MGSNEVSEGLTAVYRFEAKIDSSSATQVGGDRLSYVGLSGGFGNLSLGRVGAAGAKTGGILDNSFHYGNSYTGFRTGNAVSYANSMGSVNVQLDAIMDPKKDSDGAIDEMQLGVSLSLGDVGKIAFSHVNVENHTPAGMKTVFNPGEFPTLKGRDELTINGVDALTINGVDALTIEGTNALKVVDQDGNEVDGLMVGGTEGLGIGGTEGLGIGGAEGLGIGGTEGLGIGGNVDPAHGEVSLVNDPNNPGTPNNIMWTIDGQSIFIRSDVNDGSIRDETHTVTDGSNEISVMAVSIMSRNDPGDQASITIGTDPGEYMKDDSGDTVVYREVDCDTQGTACASHVYFADEDNVTVRTHPIAVVSSKAIANTKFVTDVPNPNLMITGKEGLMVTGKNGLMITGKNGLMITGKEGLKIVNGEGEEVNDVTGLEISGVDDLTIDGELTIEGELTIDGELTLDGGKLPEEKKVPYDMVPGSKANHVAAEFGFGAVTAFVGYSQIESNKAGSMKDKITHYGLRGSLGDSGVGFLVQLRNEELKGSKPTDSDRDPYVVNVSKSLGDGASAYIEHGTQDAKGEKAKTRIGMIVNF